MDSSVHKWDRRFLELAALVASWSKDPSTKCGAVVVRPDNTVCSVGFNGFPRGVSDAPELYADREFKYSRVVHAEVNAVLHARERVAGYTIYTHPGPSCDRCAAYSVQAGIARAVSVWDDGSDFVRRWRPEFERTASLYADAGVEVVYVEAPDLGLSASDFTRGGPLAGDS